MGTAWEVIHHRSLSTRILEPVSGGPPLLRPPSVLLLLGSSQPAQRGQMEGRLGGGPGDMKGGLDTTESGTVAAGLLSWPSR